MLKKLKKYMVLVMIIISIIVILLVILTRRTSQSNDFENDYIGVEEKNNFQVSKQISGKISAVKERNKYYVVEKILNTYIQYIKQIYGIIDFQKYDDEEIKQEGMNQLYNILDKQYISTMNVKKEDLLEKIKEYENYNIIIDKMYIYEITSSIDLYFVYGKMDEEDFQILVKTDSDNTSFSIFLEDYIQDKNYDFTMNVQDIDITKEPIDKNDNNQYRYVNISDEYMAKQYIESLKKNLLNNVQYTYSNLMEEEYKNKKFGNIQNFSKYIEDNKEEIENIKIIKYMVNSYEDYIEYVCIDNNENYYIFQETAIMDYTFKLDTYTIPTDNFKETYKVADNQKRVMMNIDKWVQMLNTRDYKSAYEVLNETFRNNTFGSQEQFTAYIKQNYPLHYKIKFSEFSEEGTTYIQRITLTDINSMNQEEKQLDIIMKLGEDIDFVMSFNVE